MAARWNYSRERFLTKESAILPKCQIGSKDDLIGESGSNIKRSWQDSLTCSNQTLAYLFKSGVLSDVTLVAGEENQHFKVHKLILASRSPLFEEMFFSEASYSSNVIPLQGDNSKALAWILHHIYCNETSLDSIGTALDVFSLADKYMVSSGYEISLKYLKCNARRHNILQIFQFWVQHQPDNASLKNICMEFFSDNGNSVLTSSFLQELTQEALRRLLQESLRVTSEAVIFKALISWGTGKVRRKRLPLSPTTIRNEILPFLSFIRFLTMTSDEFVESVVTSDILLPEECVLVLKHIASKQENSSTERSIEFKSMERSHQVWHLSISKEKRPPLIFKDCIKTCLCDHVNKTWLRDSKYEFMLSASDNIVLLAFKLQMEGEGNPFKVSVSKDDGGSSPPLATSTAGDSNVTFRNPLHLRHNMNYVVTIEFQSTNLEARGSANVSLRGETSSYRSFDAEEFTFSLRGGNYISAILFI